MVRARRASGFGVWRRVETRGCESRGHSVSTGESRRVRASSHRLAGKQNPCVAASVATSSVCDPVPEGEGERRASSKATATAARSTSSCRSRPYEGGEAAGDERAAEWSRPAVAHSSYRGPCGAAPREHEPSAGGAAAAAAGSARSAASSRESAALAAESRRTSARSSRASASTSGSAARRTLASHAVRRCARWAAARLVSAPSHLVVPLADVAAANSGCRRTTRGVGARFSSLRAALERALRTVRCAARAASRSISRRCCAKERGGRG